MEYFDNVIHLTILIGVFSLVAKYWYKQESVPISTLWFLVGGAWIGALLAYIVGNY